MTIRFLVASLLLFSLSSCQADSSDQTCSAGDESCQKCIDKDQKCGFWADQGECDRNPDFMLARCPLSCNQCGDTEVDDLMGVAQRHPGSGFPVNARDFLDRKVRSQEYMKTLVLEKALKDLCKNQHEHCTAWAVAGECETNPGCEF